jgi:hypothetical protein
VRRRENLRSASFRDYAMAEVKGLPGIVARLKFAPMREHRRPSFERMEATLLACPQCKRAVKVRKRLLLVLPAGDKYLYVCPECGSTCGETIETPAPAGRT